MYGNIDNVLNNVNAEAASYAGRAEVSTTSSVEPTTLVSGWPFEPACVFGLRGGYHEAVSYACVAGARRCRASHEWRGCRAPGQDATQRHRSPVRAGVRAHPLGSLTVGVISGKDLVWTKSYGFADELNHTPATPDTVYRIGSITKQFTATMLLQLVERGKVRLSDPVSKYYPDIEKLQGWPPAHPITLLDLATHRGGLAREPEGCQGGGLRDCQYIIGLVATWEQTLEAALPHVKIEAPPESHFQYSNVGYAILGATLAKAAQVRYTSYITQNIFRPLGMTHSGFEPDADMRRHLSKGYIGLPAGYNSDLPASELVRGRGYKVPNGAIFTTVGDLGKFVSFEMGDGPQGVLKHDVLRANYARSFPQDSSLGLDHSRDVSYGVGFEKLIVGGTPSLGTTVMSPAFRQSHCSIRNGALVSSA